jgi:hypothetical protein
VSGFGWLSLVLYDKGERRKKKVIPCSMVTELEGRKMTNIVTFQVVNASPIHRLWEITIFLVVLAFVVYYFFFRKEKE